MTALRIAVAGAGAIGATHAETITATPGIVLAGIVDPFTAGETLAARYGTARYRDIGELLGSGGVDAAIIATPNELHVPMALELIDAGIPILIEKPVATSLSEAMVLVTAAEDAGVPVLVGHHRRHHPVVRRAKEIVDSGGLGRIVAVSATYFLSKPDDYYDIAWRRSAGSGGVFLINLIHEIDMLRHLIGEITSVSAVASSAVRGLDVEDTGALTFTFDGGALGSLIISDTAAGPWSWDLTAGDSPRFPAHDVDSHRIGGTEASLTIPTLEVWRHQGERTWTTPMIPVRESRGSSNPYAGQLRHFSDVINGIAEPLVSAREGAANLAVMDAVTAAVETGRAAGVRFAPGTDSR
ncbi:MAG: Gfo/Idh/MocA family oxidoreductase [Microbacterium sp.]|jgi:predicted dehydrogenase|uniref:Gfo/Idh/MocA family protein n=1 Tax=Microbacterium sp. TaxID=51671 RepID=UPI0025D0C162|nr:Gfo/Idh/MocA family oxidoreductase [Microbacterium sp.]MBQ9916157.1 Gfo/Idh/MocA family oxidoreductase [Microbacterium sp.]